MALKPFFDKIASRLGYLTKSAAWGTLWLQAREQSLSNTKVIAPYKQHPDVYKVVKAIADNIGQAEFEFVNKDEKEIESPELSRLFNYVNPLMCRSQLWEATAVFLALKGNAFWTFNNSIGQAAGTSRLPAEIWVFNPDHFIAVRDGMGNLLSWKYRGAMTFQPDELIHFKYFNPYDPILGQSPYEAIKMTVDLDYQALIYNNKFFENGAEPGFILSTDNSLSDEQFKRLKAQWDQDHRGVQVAHKMALLEGGLKPVSTGATHRDMQFTDQRRLNREDIMGIWRVPKSMFSITDDLNYATFLGQKKMFWTDTLMPILRYITEKLNSDFFPKFAPGILGKFDFSEVLALQEDIDAKAKTAQTFFAMGVPFNIINKELSLGFDDIPGGDIGYLPFNLQPVDKINAEPAAGAQPALPAPKPKPGAGESEEPMEQPEDEPKTFHKAVDKDAIWKNFVTRLDPIEKKFETVLKNYFFKQRAKVLAGIEKSVKDGREIKIVADIHLNWGAENTELQKSSRPFIQSSIDQGVESALSLVGDGSGIDFNLFNPRVQDYLQSKLIKITDVNDTIKDQLKQELSDALANGETISQIADRVRSVYNFASNRAKVIARTESAGAMNGGQELVYRETGVTSKEWITARDERVRESHQMMDTQTVKVGKPFVLPSGELLDFPGGDGSPEEVINCRCTTIPIFE